MRCVIEMSPVQRRRWQSGRSGRLMKLGSSVVALDGRGATVRPGLGRSLSWGHDFSSLSSVSDCVAITDNTVYNVVAIHEHASLLVTANFASGAYLHKRRIRHLPKKRHKIKKKTRM